MSEMSTIEANMHILIFLHKYPEWANEVKIEKHNGELAIFTSPNATAAFVAWMNNFSPASTQDLGRKFLRMIDDITRQEHGENN